MPAIDFRRLAEDDLPLLFDWLARPHVRRHYAPQPGSFAEVAARYGPRTREDNVVKAFIVALDGAEAGYVQAYAIDEFPEYERILGSARGTVGVDLFLAEESACGRGLGAKVIRRFVDEVAFGRYGAAACVAGVAEGNARGIRAFERAGFARWKRVVNEKGEPECVLRLEREASEWRAATIDLLDAEQCIENFRAMYLESFGTAEGLQETLGVDNAVYLRQLRRRIAEFPEGNVHLWQAGRIAAQLEMRLVEHEPHVGYVSVLYVDPAFRGRGLGRRMHEHAAQASRARGMRLMRLSVSRANVNAMVFYRRLGWTVVGGRPNTRPMAIMEFALS